MRTQKAKGILVGIHEIFQKYPHLCKFFAPMAHRLISHGSQLASFKDERDFPVFGRPCPVRPRHGFVDSQVLNNKYDLDCMWNQSVHNDKHAEVILGPYMNAVDYNGIYVSSGNIAIGVGNDGATGGKDSISFPVAPTKFTKKIKRLSGVKDDELYLESIMQEGWWHLTQVRGGPALNIASADYIPAEVKVTDVISPHDNLIKWEEEVKLYKDVPGVVVFGNGHTLASHAAIHCILNKVPFITTECPKMGQVLQPTLNAESPKLNRQRFREGMWAADRLLVRINSQKHVQNELQKHFYFALSVLHNWAYLKNSTEADWLLGAATQTLSRICSALCFGEHRHMYEGNGGVFSDKDRSSVYVKALNCEVSFLNSLSQVFKDFYSREWSGGFGGPPWATCAWYSLKLWGRVVRTNNKNTSTLSDAEVADVIGTVNKLVNLAHNNGWWFNKFTTEKDFDFIANEPGLAAFTAAEVFHKVAEQRRLNKGKTYSKIDVPKRVISPAGRDKDGRLIWVSSYHRTDEAGGLTSLFYFREDGKKKHIEKYHIGVEAVRAINNARDKKNLPVHAMHALKVRDGQVTVPGKKEPVNISSLLRKKKAG